MKEIVKFLIDFNRFTMSILKNTFIIMIVERTFSIIFFAKFLFSFYFYNTIYFRKCYSFCIKDLKYLMYFVHF